MDQLKEIFCRYDMVCDNPSGVGFELYTMPEFFAQRRGMEGENPSAGNQRGKTRPGLSQVLAEKSGSPGNSANNLRHCGRKAERRAVL